MDGCPRSLKLFLLFWSQISLFQLVSFLQYFPVFFLLHCSLQVSCQFLSFIDSCLAILPMWILYCQKGTADSPKCLGAWTTKILLLFIFYPCAACRCVCIVTEYVGAGNSSCYAGKRQRSSERSRHFYVHRVSTHTVHMMTMH